MKPAPQNAFFGRRATAGRRSIHRVATLWAFLAVAMSAAEAFAQSAGAGPDAPARRVRRRYDGRIQFYDLQESTPQPLPSKKDDAPNPRGPLTLGESATSSLTQGVAAPAVSVKIRPQNPDEGEDATDGLWITSSVSAILGVEIARTNAFGVGNWGWLARDVRNAVATNRVARAAARRREDADAQASDEEEDPEAAPYRPPLIIQPQMNGGQGPQPAPSPDSPSRHAVRFSPDFTERDAPPPGGLEISGRGSASFSIAAPSPAGTRPEPPPAEYSESRRRIEEATAGHRPDAMVQRLVPNSSELARQRLDAAAQPPSLSGGDRGPVIGAPAAHDRPLLSGSPENYGRRGDIFSSNFRSSSMEAGALPAPSWGRPESGGFAPPPAVAPAAGMTLPSLRPSGGLSGFDLMKPFDPAGRALTEQPGRR